MGWSSFPPEHKKSFYCGLSLYVLCACAVGAWVYFHAKTTLQERQARTLHASVAVSAVYTGDTTTAKSAPPQSTGDTASVTPLPSGSGGAITIVMTGLGLSQDMTVRILKELPANITLAFSPYSPSLQDWLRTASTGKHTSLVMVPMEPATYPKDDPGPLALLTRQSADENAKHLAFILDNAQGTVGVINQMGSAFLGDKKNMYAFLGTLHQRGDLFIENPAGGMPQATALAAQSDVPYLSADVTIDENANPRDVQQALLNLEKIARQRGYALGIAHPYPVTIDALETWAAHISERAINLVPPQTLLKVQAEKMQEQENAASVPQPAPVTAPTPPISGGVTSSPATP